MAQKECTFSTASGLFFRLMMSCASGAREVAWLTTVASGGSMEARISAGGCPPRCRRRSQAKPPPCPCLPRPRSASWAAAPAHLHDDQEEVEHLHHVANLHQPAGASEGHLEQHVEQHVEDTDAKPAVGVKGGRSGCAQMRGERRQRYLPSRVGSQRQGAAPVSLERPSLSSLPQPQTQRTHHVPTIMLTMRYMNSAVRTSCRQGERGRSVGPGKAPRGSRTWEDDAHVPLQRRAMGSRAPLCLPVCCPLGCARPPTLRNTVCRDSVQMRPMLPSA